MPTIVDPRFGRWQNQMELYRAISQPPAQPVQQEGSSVVTYGGPRGQPVAGRSTGGYDYSRLDAIAQANNAQEQIGGGGFFGALLGNPIVQTALKPLAALDVPRRYIASTAQELADVIGDGDASWEDWKSQAQDPTFGFGDMVDSTGNKWLDRIIGFAGDVALDPLTYLTLGTSKVLGGAGRTSAAIRAADAALPEEALARWGSREALVDFVGRKGPGALDDATRQAIGLEKGGLRFGTRNHNVRVTPSAVTRGPASLWGSARTAFNRTGPGDSLRRMRAPAALEPAMRRLATGEGPITATQAAGLLGRDFAEQGAEGLFRSQFDRELYRTLRQNRGDMDGVLQRIEAGDLSGAAAPVADIMGRIRGAASEMGVDIGDIPNYVPHRWHPKAVKFLNSPQGRELKELLSFDPNRATGSVLAREFVPGSTLKLKGRAIQFPTATIDEINTKLTEAFPEAGLDEWMDTDPVRVLGGYLDSISANVGAFQGQNRLRDMGIARGFDDASADVVDIQGTKFANARRADLLQGQRADIYGESTAVRKGMRDTSRSLLGELDERALDLATDPAVAATRAAEAEQLLDTVRAMRPPRSQGKKPPTVEDYAQFHEELRAVTAQIASPEDAVTAGLLADHAKGLAQLHVNAMTAGQAGRMMHEARNGNLVRVMMRQLEEGWQQIGQGLRREGDELFVPAEVNQAMVQLRRATKEPGKFGRMIDWYQQFFKTYATATPGFHVRNGVTATFNNAADGVSFNHMRKGAQIWRSQRTNNPLPRGVSPEEADEVMRIVFASGASGQFEAAELGQRSFGHQGKIINNPFTRRVGKQPGEFVEGTVRAGMALDSLRRGDTFDEAVARVTRMHFNYGNLSDADRTMKRIVPFWTFMSRNLPLQVQQMWMRPKAYQHYLSFVRNFSEENDENTPLHWLEAGAFNTGLNVPGTQDPLYLQPDMPFLDPTESLNMAAEDPLRLLSNVSPQYRVPLELYANKRSLSGTPFFEGDNKLLYAAQQMIPQVSQQQRLLPTEPYYKDKAEAARLRFLGLPFQQLSPSAIEGEKRRRMRALEEYQRGNR